MRRKDEYPVTIKVRFNFKVSNTQKACFAVHKMFYYFCFIVPFLLKKKKIFVTMSHSYRPLSVRKSMIPFSLLRNLYMV